MGRAFTQQEDEGSQQVALLSYPTWRSRFDGDAHRLGRKILLDRKPYEIIGVMPREFEFPLVPSQLNLHSSEGGGVEPCMDPQGNGQLFPGPGH